MLLALVIIASIFFLFIIPFEVLRRYYSPSKYSTASNIFWIITAVITWPLVPIALAVRIRDKALLSALWVTFLIWAVSIGYWLTLNVETYIQFQQQFVM